MSTISMMRVLMRALTRPCPGPPKLRRPQGSIEARPEHPAWTMCVHQQADASSSAPSAAFRCKWLHKGAPRRGGPHTRELMRQAVRRLPPAAAHAATAYTRASSQHACAHARTYALPACARIRRWLHELLEVFNAGNMHRYDELCAR